ncbi:DUF397 domain-containing protein [Amycolatopsis sp. K13G38]|uniref:DUF397 domain-containing protein n=1 Tax=Amycolatopsis acididurans TaxID=2724524 RepID=A0ABX1JHH2_9PSEU|nr:DUF397 domain-containing protein [Amycolatopsis acididurans]NKQ58819.1 DUF397 domain-containing protein [Amycolatopsis acididurans]
MANTPPDFAPHEFRKSSFSGENGNNCVMVAQRDGWVAILDSKAGLDGPRLVFTADEFDALKAGLSTSSDDPNC